MVIHPDEGTRSLCQPSRDARKSSADLPGTFESATADRTLTAMTSGKTCGFAGEVFTIGPELARRTVKAGAPAA